MFGSGANMAFRADVLRGMGGFDPALGSGSRALGGEDLAVTFAAIQAGFQVAYEPSAVVHHLHHTDYHKLRRQVYGYGVGLSAYVTQTAVSRPASLRSLLIRLPRAAWYALHPGSGKNQSKAAGYPRELTLLEIRGLIYGPFAYLRSRRRVHKEEKAR
jgi:cellulose synthase/poly-beta-1,6-N-acetylglucosamine synthase-like glycosyltransferase